MCVYIYIYIYIGDLRLVDGQTSGRHLATSRTRARGGQWCVRLYSCTAESRGAAANGASACIPALHCAVVSWCARVNDTHDSTTWGEICATSQDHVEDKIRCNCVCPGRVHTPFVDGHH